MKVEELEQDPKVKNWFVYVNPKDATRKSYLNNLKIYCDFIGKSPIELIEEADNEAESGILLKKRKIKEYITSYINYLNNSKTSANTKRLRLAVVKSFYKYNDVELSANPRRTNNVCLEENIPIPTKEDLQYVLGKCDLLKKAILLCGVTSGLSRKEIINLKVSNFKNGYDPETEITTLPLRREKTKVDFITFLSPETSRAIIEYLKFRNNRTSKRKNAYRESQLEKQKVFSNDDYLFINSRVQKKYVESGKDEDRKLKDNTFLELYRSISEKSNMNSGKGKYNLIRSHNLRRYFYSVLTNNGCNRVIAEFLMGHKLSETEIGYYRANPLKLREQYQKYIPYLTIQKELDISENPEYQRVIDENENLKQKVETVSVDRDEFRQIEKQIEIDRMRHSMQVLKLYKKIHPDKAEGYQKMINNLEEALEKM